MQDTTYPELGCYLLAGAPRSPRDLIDEVVQAERLGLGSAFISERWNIKEAATLCGAAGAVSSSLRIVTGDEQQHPPSLVTASFATTMHRLTGGRFTLGLGRGSKVMFDMFGLPAITTAELEDFAGLMRRLWRGETIVGHSGPAGDHQLLALDPAFDEVIPLGLVALGPRTLELAGRAFDTVVLHTFFTDETTSRCVDLVKRSAERAGRDPDAVKVWACLATVGDYLPRPSGGAN
ncbi:TIGR03857 family LLM class F420-dependent oxidoreductase [Acrocarpospora sp. B8E8]|uniref:TIGR03857 family LLM class F420-dependent oxidoreductase n=1 Tax=Acrocarpospora sp. B8E8 TaxID=3153572 RepID=UPI00325F3EAE